MSKKPLKPMPSTECGLAPGEDRWHFADCELALASRELRRAGQVVAIEPKPLNLLLLLLRAPGELATKEELIDSLWDGRVVSEGVITNCVNKLRLALGDEGQQLIKTVHGYGYRFVGPVQRLHASPGRQPMQFAKGDAVPGRPHWLLHAPLTGVSETWVARQAKTGERRVFKFARDSTQLRALKREVTLYRLLRETLGKAAPVARLLDYQLDQPPCFIELEYCEAGSLLDWLSAGGAASNLDTRLDLMIQAAEAVATVHAQGVLHKDLKPANFLLSQTDDGQTRLVLADFGCGQLSEPDRLDALAITRLGLTEAGAVSSEGSGTRLYLAPELLAGQPRTLRSDIFSLGVMLYQMVVGDAHRGLAPGWERDVPDPLLREDIAATAERDPLLRLGDAAELVHRLRTLDQRRVARQTAEQQEAENRRAHDLLALERQRRPWTFALAASLMLGLLGTGVMTIQAYGDRQRAESAAMEAEHLNEFLNEEVLAAADPYRAGGGREVRVGVLLDQAAKRLPALESQPAFHARLSLTIARAYANLGLNDEAIAMLTHALARQGPKLGELNPAVRQMRDRLAWMAVDDARYEDARPQFQHLLESAELLPEPKRSEGLRQARYGMARLTFEQGGFEQSVVQYRALLAEGAENEDEREFRREVEWDLAEALMETRGWDEAWRLLAGVERHFAETAGLDGPRQQWIKVSQGYWLQMHERWDEAEAVFQKLSRDSAAALGNQHPLYITCQQFLGMLRIKQGHSREALPYLQTVLTWRQRHYREGHHLTNMTRMRIGEALIGDGRAGQAVVMLEQVLADSSRMLGERHPHTLDILRTLAEAQLATGQAALAESTFRQVLARGAAMPPTNNRLNWARYGLGRSLLAQSNIEAAKPLLDQARRDFSTQFGVRYSAIASIQLQLQAISSGHAAPVSVAGRQPTS
ncbi:MAG: tetratricopeptide repeat protein [Pseudomonadota bacterium]